MAKLSTILDQIDAGSMLLPEFQRGYVWNRDQVRGLMRSLYHGYPVGALLVWETEGAGQAVRGAIATAGQKHLLLDGQQRITTLYGILRGRAPSFFEGDAEAFTGLRFNVETEQFQFHAPSRMKGDPLWLDVTALFANGGGDGYGPLLDLNWVRPHLNTYMNRILKLQSVSQREFHVEHITGPDKTVDVVVDIFNRVNSGGTKLSKGDLALARICAEWSEARPTMRRELDRWAARGYHFTPDWLLRNVNAVASGRAPLSALENVTAEEFRTSLGRSLDHVEHFLDLVSGRLGLDHDRVLAGRYGFPVISRLLELRGSRFTDGEEADQALYWYVLAALRGHFVGPTETVLAKDLETVEKSGVPGLITNLRRGRRAGLAVTAEDFEGLGRGSRAYPLLYLLTRVRHARDLATGRALGEGASALQVHEIFPKAELYRHGYSRGEVNAVANLGFLVPSSAIALGRRPPADYLAHCDAATLRSQWIPADPRLWQVEHYRDFLAARRSLLAAAANEFLDVLVAGTHPWDGVLEAVAVSPEADDSDARAAQLRALLEELGRTGYAQPRLDTEIADPDTGRVLAVAEAFWPDGLQVGQGAPVVLELDPDEADGDRLAELGFEVFTSVDSLLVAARRRRAETVGDTEGEEQVDGLAPAPVGEEPRPPSGASDRAARAFEDALRTAIEASERDLRYNPRALKVMISEDGGVGAARRLLRTQPVSDGFVRLWECQRLDLSVEAVALDDRFAALFTDAEREMARTRLDEFGWARVPVPASR